MIMAYAIKNATFVHITQTRDYTFTDISGKKHYSVHNTNAFLDMETGVISGKTGFTGGINLGDEYINRKERFGYWKDTAVMIKGDAVQSLTMLFLQMWNVSELKKEKFEPYLTTMAKELKPETGFVLPYGDSPYDHENVGEEVYVHILNHAKKYVHIMTPYLILDNGMLVH